MTAGGVTILWGVFLFLGGCGSAEVETLLWGHDMERRVEGKGVLVPPGIFMMGSPETEPGRYPPEQTHEVKLTRGFVILATEVTQGLYEEVTGGNPSKFSECGANCPVEEVSFVDAVRFCNRLSEREGLPSAYGIRGQRVTWNVDSLGYRLPSEAEWEYAARAGNKGRYPSGGPPEAVAWYQKNARGKTHPVGTLRGNGWGLFDTSGNVREWVWDFPGYFGTEYAIDPTGPTKGAERMTRGGSWSADDSRVRNAYRKPAPPSQKTPHVGFRVVRTVERVVEDAAE